MLFEGNLSVLQNILEKNKLLVEGDVAHNKIRPALLVLSGTMRGVYGSGQIRALEKAGLTSVFDVAVGISTGAPTVAYFVSGQAVFGTSVYPEECTTPEFINTKRFFSRGSPVDTGYLSRIFRGECSNKKLDQQAILESRTSLYAGVTCANTGEGVFLDMKQALPDIVEAIQLSMSFPGLSARSIHTGLGQYVDGVGALPFPAPRVIRDFAPTDLLVLANCPEKARGRKNLVEFLFSPLLFRDCGRMARKMFSSRSARAQSDIAVTRQQKQCRVAIIWSDEHIGKFERNSKKLRIAAKRAERHLSALLEKARSFNQPLTSV